VDVLDLGPAVLAVVDDDRPVTLRVPITNGTFSYTPLADDDKGPAATYGPVTGTLELAPGAAGGPPVVLLDGQPLTATDPPAGPPGPGPPEPGPAPPGAGVPPLASGPPAATARLRLVRRPRLRGRTVTLVLELPGPGALELRATAKLRARTRALGTLRKSIRAQGRRTVKLKLKLKPPARVRLAISFKPAGGATQTQNVTVRLTR
jgi:hypothetical protein